MFLSADDNETDLTELASAIDGSLCFSLNDLSKHAFLSKLRSAHFVFISLSELSSLDSIPADYDEMLQVKLENGTCIINVCEQTENNDENLLEEFCRVLTLMGCSTVIALYGKTTADLKLFLETLKNGEKISSAYANCFSVDKPTDSIVTQNVENTVELSGNLLAPSLRQLLKSPDESREALRVILHLVR